DQIDESCLAGAVRADQRVTRSGLQRKVDVAGDLECPEVLAESAGFENRSAHRLFLKIAVTSSAIPSRPRRAKSTARTRTRPIPSCQYCGYCFASWSSRIM